MQLHAVWQHGKTDDKFWKKTVAVAPRRYVIAAQERFSASCCCRKCFYRIFEALVVVVALVAKCRSKMAPNSAKKGSLESCLSLLTPNWNVTQYSATVCAK